LANKILSIIGGFVGSVALVVAGWAINANVEIKLLRTEITQMRADQHRDQEQDDNIKGLWRWISYLNEQIDQLRFKAGMPPATKPNL
jgi:hypothetical protein